MNRISNHIRSNVIGYLALFVAISGSAYAAATVGPKDIRKSAVRAKHIKRGQVAAKHLKAAAVKANKIAPGAVGSDQLGDDAVNTRHIAAGAVGTQQLADGAVTAQKLDPNAIPELTIEDGSVTTEKLADEAVTAQKVAPGAIGSAQINSDEVQRRVANGCTVGTFIIGIQANGSVDCATVSAAPGGGLFHSSLGNNRTLGILADGVTTDKLADNAVATGKLADSAVTAAKLANGSVNATKLANNSVNTAQIVNGAVATAKLADGAATRVKTSVFDGFDFYDPPNIAAGTCVDDVLRGSGYNQVQVGDVGYLYPLASLASGLMVQNGIRQSVLGEFQIRICNISNSAINDTGRVYGVRLVR